MLWSYCKRSKQNPTKRSHAERFADTLPSIDGVLLHTQKPIRRAAEALTLLQSEKIPFILLTNGGGKHESDRVAELSRHLGVPLDTSNFLQSHTPFAQFVHGHQTSGSDALRDKCVLVVGGESDNCRKVAEK